MVETSGNEKRIKSMSNCRLFSELLMGANRLALLKKDEHPPPKVYSWLETHLVEQYKGLKCFNVPMEGRTIEVFNSNSSVITRTVCDDCLVLVHEYLLSLLNAISQPFFIVLNFESTSLQMEWIAIMMARFPTTVLDGLQFLGYAHPGRIIAARLLNLSLEN